MSASYNGLDKDFRALYAPPVVLMKIYGRFGGM